MRLRKTGHLVLIAGGILYGICTDLAHAGALYLYEVAVATDTGYAGAGLAARAGDAGTVFSNPAGMTRFEEATFLAGVTPLYIDASFHSDSGTTVSGPDDGVFEPLVSGTVAAIFPVGDKLRLGISAQNFFGLALDWGGQWVGRYETTEVALFAPQVQPTVAYQVTKWLSIGAGAGLTVGVLAYEGRVNNVNPNSRDGRLKYDDVDFAIQGNFGVMIEPSDKTRIGLRYLTETDLDFKSNIYLSGVDPLIADLMKGIGEVNLGTKMPQSLMAGIFHQINEQWAVLGSVGWDDWSQFSRVRVKVDGTGIDKVVDADFDDTWHFGVGAQYQYTPKWMFTAGISYDSATASSSVRPIEMPLASMTRYAAGFKYRKSDKVTLGAGLSFLWEGNTKVKPAGNPVRGEVSGEYENINITFLSLYSQW